MVVRPIIARVASTASLTDRHRHGQGQFQPRPPPEDISQELQFDSGSPDAGSPYRPNGPDRPNQGDGSTDFHSHDLGTDSANLIGNDYPGNRSALAEANAQEARTGGVAISIQSPSISPGRSLAATPTDSQGGDAETTDSSHGLTFGTKADLNNHGHHPSTSPQKRQEYLADPDKHKTPRSDVTRVQTMPLYSPSHDAEGGSLRNPMSPHLEADPMKQAQHDRAHRARMLPERLTSKTSISSSSDAGRTDALRNRRRSTQGVEAIYAGRNKNAFGYAFLSNTGSEPGVDVRKDPGRYAELQEPARVTIVDYSSDGQGTRYDIPGSKLDSFLQSDEGKRPGGIPGQDATEGFKSVRWINVDGMNFDIIRTLGLQYELHPLAVEDALRAAANPRSKVDFYANHLYAQILIQYTNEEDEEELRETARLGGADTGGEDSSYEQTKKKGKSSLGSIGRLVKMGAGKDMQSLPDGVEGVFEPVETYHSNRSLGKRPNPHRMTIDHLSAKYMIPLRKSVLSTFLMRDGTLLTLSASPFSGILDPIYLRLENEDGLLRRTCDVSMLLEGILDVVVDIAIEICQAFEVEILKMEAGCLVNPQMESVRHLHVISSQLSRLKRTFSPLMHLLYTLRDQDSQRAIASMIFSHGQNAPGTSTPSLRPRPTGMGGGSGYGLGMGMGIGGAETKGYISQTTRVYMSDVVDHLETVLSSLDQYIATCDHLTDYIFNMLSFITNESMERLSLVTVVFLPLTFLAGYFGMNFTGFGDIEGSVVYFWKIAAPLTAGFFMIFCYGYIRDMIGRGLRILARRRRVEMVERQHSTSEKDAGGIKRHRARKL